MGTEAAVEATPLGDEQDEASDDGTIAAQDAEQAQPVNFALMALYQIVLRTGWIFKTESIIMPAVLDTIGGPGWLRGCLPMLNRFGQSIPPVLASGRIHAAGRKKLVLASSTLMMGLSFLGLAAIWWTVQGEARWWMPFAFLALYAVFFMSTGINQLTFGTLTGKLIPVQSRGRLLSLASTLGTASAVGCAAWLLPGWLSGESGNFFAIFALTGALFVAAAVTVLLLDEPRDHFARPTGSVLALFRSAGTALADDRNLRRIAVTSALFGVSLTLFPHYQALGRERLGLGLDALMPWVITQNLGVALFSVPAGWLADRSGNRVVLRVLLAVVCTVPIVALILSHDRLAGGSSFTTVFFLLGATPVTLRTVTNYCLELAPREQQPRYLSTLGLCTAGPAILTAPLVGGLVDLLGFETVFLLVEGFMIGGWLLTWRIVEPREGLDLDID